MSAFHISIAAALLFCSGWRQANLYSNYYVCSVFFVYFVVLYSFFFQEIYEELEAPRLHSRHDRSSGVSVRLDPQPAVYANQPQVIVFPQDKVVQFPRTINERARASSAAY